MTGLKSEAKLLSLTLMGGGNHEETEVNQEYE